MFKFNENGRFFIFMNKLLDVLLLNVLWLVFCIPLVTIGAATVAAYSVVLKMVDDEECYIARTFLREFKGNFCKGTPLWLINAAALYALYIHWQIATKSENPSLFMIIAGIFLAALTFSFFIYAYPLLARYETTVYNSMKNSAKIVSRYFGKTIAIAVLIMIEIAVFSWNGTMLIFGVLIGPMLVVYTISGIAKRIFHAIEDSNEA